MGIKEVLRKVQRFWKYIIILVLLLAIRFLWGGYVLRKVFVEHGYEVKPFSHLLYMVISIVLVFVIKENSMKYFKPIVYKRVENVWSPDMWAEKKAKAAINVVSLIWYTISCVLGLYLCWDSPSIPAMFYGS